MNKIVLLLIVCLLLSTVALACSSFRISTTDGCVFYARTMEDPYPMGETISIIPAGTKYTGLLPDGSQNGLKWTSKYGVVGINSLGLPVVCDGVNEAGLAVGMLLYPGYAEYYKYDAKTRANTISQVEVPTWILTNCASVAEVRSKIASIQVCKGATDHAGDMPVHFTVHDKTGDSIVIEYTKGKLNVFDNPLGVLTNAPSFDWHMTNLKNYANIDIPVGAVRGVEGAPAVNTDGNVKTPFAAAVTQTGKVVMDRCLWVDIVDFSRMRLYYRNYNDMNWRYVDVKQALKANKAVASIPLYTQGVYTDDTAKAKTVKNSDPKFYNYQNP